MPSRARAMMMGVDLRYFAGSITGERGLG